MIDRLSKIGRWNRTKKKMILFKLGLKRIWLFSSIVFLPKERNWPHFFIPLQFSTTFHCCAFCFFLIFHPSSIPARHHLQTRQLFCLSLLIPKISGARFIFHVLEASPIVSFFFFPLFCQQIACPVPTRAHKRDVLVAATGTRTQDEDKHRLLSADDQDVHPSVGGKFRHWHAVGWKIQTKFRHNADLVRAFFYNQHVKRCLKWFPSCRLSEVGTRFLRDVISQPSVTSLNGTSKKARQSCAEIARAAQ